MDHDHIRREFEGAMATRGIISPPGGVVADGKLHRCDAEGKNGRGDAAYVLYPDSPPAGGFENWRDGRGWQNWRPKGNGRSLTVAEEREQHARLEAARKARDADRVLAQGKAAENARRLWEGAPAADPSHPYLIKKNIGEHDLRVDRAGGLLVPMWDFTGNLWNVQRIDPDGNKRFLLNGRTAGLFYAKGPDPDQGGTIVLAEGAATALSIFEATGLPVVAAMSAGNLTAVGIELRKRFPKARLVIFADNDPPGLKHATEAAHASGGLIAVPPKEGDDANDLYAREGAEAVRVALDRAVPPPKVLNGAEGAQFLNVSIFGGDEHLREETRREEDRPVPLYVRSAADIEPRSVSWLWPERLPLGKLVVFAGEPGTAKSRLSLSIASTITTGGYWPAGEGRSEAGEVLIANFEDDPADTTVPRLMAEGADLTKIRFLEGVPGENGRRAFDINRDVDRLAAHLEIYPETRLLIVDPISACMGGADSHKNAEVRAALHPLAEVAQRYEVCVLAITHLNKGIGGKALHRVMGSIAYTAAARVAFVVTRDENDPGGRRSLVIPIKNNLGDDRTGLSFSTDVVRLPSGFEAPRIVWGEQMNISADEALSPLDNDRGARAAARDFLEELLIDGPVSAKEVRAQARSAGIAWATVRRAQDSLGVKTRKGGMKEGWVWELPPKMLTGAEGAQPHGVSTFGGNERLREEAAEERHAPAPAESEELGRSKTAWPSCSTSDGRDFRFGDLPVETSGEKDGERG